MKKTLQYLQTLEKWIIVIAFAIMVLACFIQVVNRNVFRIPVSGFEEAAKYSMVYMVLLGTELGLRDGTQISIQGVVDKLPEEARKIIRVIARLIVIIFAAVMTKSGWAMVMKQAKIGQTSPGLGIPMYIPYFALVLGFGLITIVQSGYLIKQCLDFNKAEEKEE